MVMTMTSLKLITFDVTNTILRILGGVGQQYANIARMYDVPADPDKLNQAFMYSWKEQNSQYPNYGSCQGVTSHFWWGELVEKCFLRAGYGLDKRKISIISSHLFKHFSTSQGWEVVEGTHQVLQHVKSLGIKVGVLSNFDDRLEKILRSTALLHYFDFVICSQVIKIAKPDPEIFHKALELSQCAPAEALHVGDNVEKDYYGAKNVGMTSILFCNDKSKIPNNVDKDFVISDLNEVCKYLK